LVFVKLKSKAASKLLNLIQIDIKNDGLQVSSSWRWGFTLAVWVYNVTLNLHLVLILQLLLDLL